jgi:2-polyprenyl-3-methyl-5-hydroxy-6-metoxy-1,4-benzoquinol methylase
MSTRDYLCELFSSRFKLENLTSLSSESFISQLSSKIGVVDPITEGYLSGSRQRDLSVKFHWGHNHDFGPGFLLHGRMADRHIDLIADFVEHYGLPRDLSGKRVLDIGVWTGGTSLLLAAMGADVVAIEEVVKYAQTVNFLADGFGIQDKLQCHSGSLYEVLPRFADCFDYAIYAGVVYHVTDPVLSLRLIFSALKDGGTALLESYACDSKDSVCRYEGPSVTHSGTREDYSRGGWNYFVPSARCLQAWCQDAGFQETHVGACANMRIQGSAKRTHFDEFCRAGVSSAACR